MKLRTDLRLLPDAAGVYLMRDDVGKVLYVGKALSLRSRVRQYFSGDGDGRQHVRYLRPRIVEVEWILTESERDALILENTLIKKHQPRYNVRLKDDKTWLHLKLSVADTWPRLSLVRRARADRSRYFGPYLQGVSAKTVARALRRAFPLRDCSDGVFRAHRRRACIEYDIGRCAGPCAGHIAAEPYKQLVSQAVAFLEGRGKAVSAVLRQEMEASSEAMNYERAAKLRDRWRALEAAVQHQQSHRPGAGDADIFGLHRQGSSVCVVQLSRRRGKLGDAVSWPLERLPDGDGALLQALLLQRFGAGGILSAPEVILPVALPDGELVADVLSERAGRKVRLLLPRRGEKAALLKLANRNAEARLGAEHDARARAEKAVESLQKRLKMPSLPSRIECYDMSNIQGTDPVGSMVSFLDGLPDRSRYRTFRIKTVVGPDDYASMREVIGRRLTRVGQVGWELPDLVVVDGGRGQLRMAMEASSEAGHPDIPLVALAKPREGEAGNPDQVDKIFLPGRRNPIILRRNDPVLLLLQRLRDEAHRFGVQHHRKRRRNRSLTSELDSVPGLGPQKRKSLLKARGSLTAVRASTYEELLAVEGIGPALAKRLRTYFSELEGAGA